MVFRLNQTRVKTHKKLQRIDGVAAECNIGIGSYEYAMERVVWQYCEKLNENSINLF